MNKKLVAYRKMLDITQLQMAQEIGVSLTTYNHKETGKKEFNQSEMVSITDIIKAKVPNVTMDEIFFNNRIGNLLNKVL
ncbi:helix-turn-helix transcriptional regulator [Clostridium paridis]|uniref:Helix-turn-helix domain-containing protein n=1 Tax=Clostridium paridis TaxID=2803863 RepID=A0A937FH25_9CLOT|nr:helix-turn-helix domain-containing protein [Clostridium paridis]MBL4933023.1 helix-turn-helix domain-containing protein [Clostridium paridis]